MPAYVSILLWRVGIYNTEFGLLNKILVALGFGKVNFLSTNVPAFLSCMTLNLWMALPFMIMMIDGALSSIDRSYYESAELDGEEHPYYRSGNERNYCTGGYYDNIYHI